MPRSSKQTASFRLPQQNPTSIYLLSYTCHILHPFYPPSIHDMNIRWVVQIMKHFSPASYYFFWVMPKYLSQTPILEYIQSVTHVTPTNTLCYNLCVPYFTWPLHISALLSRHLQADDTKISLKHGDKGINHQTHKRNYLCIKYFISIRAYNCCSRPPAYYRYVSRLTFNSSVVVLTCTRNCCVRIYEVVVLGRYISWLGGWASQ